METHRFVTAKSFTSFVTTIHFEQIYARVSGLNRLITSCALWMCRRHLHRYMCTPPHIPVTVEPPYSRSICSNIHVPTGDIPYLAQESQVWNVVLIAWSIPNSKVRGANMGPIWDRQDPGGPHVGPMNLAIWHIQQVSLSSCVSSCVMIDRVKSWTYIIPGLYGWSTILL